jgi:hypothetical protein
MGVKIQIAVNRAAGIGTFVQRLDSPAMRLAAARGLNEHIRVQEKDSVATVAAGTKIPASRVARISKVRLASPAGAMDAAVVFTDQAIPLGEFTYRAWSRGMLGARAGDWRGQTYRGAFTIAAYGGRIYRRRGSQRGPLQMLWGPVLPSELMRRDMPNLKAREAFAERDLERRVVSNMLHAFGF